MKKNAILVLLLAVAMFVGVGNAFCYTTTITDPWFTTPNLYDPNGDRIGNIAFEIYKMDVIQSGNSITFDIYSNFPSTGYGVSGWITKPADLRLRVGSADYGVAFTNHHTFTRGKLYQINPVNGWYISGYDRPYNGFYWHYEQPVHIQTGSAVNDNVNAVSWNSPSGSDSIYRISTTLNKSDFIPGGYNGNIYAYYGGATCANDYIGGDVPIVPEPATLSLLGIGLLGLLRFRKKS